MKLPSGKKSAGVDTAAIRALSKTEKYALKAFQEWGELFESSSKRSGRARNKRGGATEKPNLEDAAVRLIDDMATTLTELRRELQEVGRPAQSR